MRKGFLGTLTLTMSLCHPTLYVKTDFSHPHLQTGTEGFVLISPEMGLPETGKYAALVPFPSPQRVWGCSVPLQPREVHSGGSTSPSCCQHEMLRSSESS